MIGKFIVIYGINNIGKSTQGRMLMKALRNDGVDAVYVKYPIYDLAPTGPRLNRILREGEEGGITELALQNIYTQNRRDFEPQLREQLGRGVWVVAEDYTGTGLAWGWTKGVDLATLEEMNKGLLNEDLALLLDGHRFVEAKEQNHIHEREDSLVEECRKKHVELAKRYGWRIVNANRSKEEVAEEIKNFCLFLFLDPVSSTG